MKGLLRKKEGRDPSSLVPAVPSAHSYPCTELKVLKLCLLPISSGASLFKDRDWGLLIMCASC